MKNFLAPLCGVRAQFKDRRSLWNFHAKLSISRGDGLDVDEGELHSHCAVFTPKNKLGSFELRFPARFLLAKPRYAIRFIAHKISNPSECKFSRCKFSRIPPFQALPTIVS